MIAANLAGISVFATGGIGGVHRGAELSFDISADLHELAQTSVTVVAAGTKGDFGRAKGPGSFGNLGRAGDHLSTRQHSGVLVAGL